MHFEYLEFENFKSFDHERIDFDKFTTIIGANAAGKSNIVSVFRFISNIMRYGVEDAISLLGGMEYIENASTKGNLVKIAYAINFEDEVLTRIISQRKLGVRIAHISNDFHIKSSRRKLGYMVEYDKLEIKYSLYHFDETKKGGERLTPTGDHINLRIIRKTDDIDISCTLEQQEKKEINYGTREEIIEYLGINYFKNIMMSNQDSLFLSRIDFLMNPRFSRSNFIKIFDFDPKRLKKSSSVISVNNLEEDGSNLASILQKLLKDNRKNKLMSLLTRILPFVESINTQKNVDQTVTLKIREGYVKKDFPANFLSDGTLSVIAIIVALYFENQSSIIILEEPERNIHPAILQRIVEMAESVSKNKQIVFTTHNPEVLKRVNIESLRFVKRDDAGHSVVSKPADNEDVKNFLDNDLGVDDLFVQKILE